MKPAFLISVVILPFIFFCSIYVEVDAGFEGILCPDNRASLFANVTNTSTPIPCLYHCRTNHNSTDGVCTTDGNFNCICSNTPNPTPTNVLILISDVNGHCTYYDSQSNIYIVQGCQCYLSIFPFGIAYEALCDVDCKCLHGAKGGSCDFQTHQCLCDYDFAAGTSWTNDTANPTCTVQDAATAYNGLVALQALLPKPLI